MQDRIGHVFLVLLLVVCCAFGQQAIGPGAAAAPNVDAAKVSKAPAAKIAADMPANNKIARSPWLERATYLTAQLEEDSLRMKDFRDALLKARIGQAWWPADEKRALQYLNSVAEAVQSDGQNESDEGAAARFRVLEPLVLITTQLTPDRPAKKDLHAKFQKALLSAADNLADSPQLKNSSKLQGAVNRAVSGIAREAQANRRLDDAIPAMQTLIRLQGSATLFHMILSLYQQDQTRGEQLFLQAVDEGRTSWNSTSAANAVSAAFPEFHVAVQPSERMQKAAGEFYADTLLLALQGDEQKKGYATLVPCPRASRRSFRPRSRVR